MRKLYATVDNMISVNCCWYCDTRAAFFSVILSRCICISTGIHIEDLKGKWLANFDEICHARLPWALIVHLFKLHSAPIHFLPVGENLQNRYYMPNVKAAMAFIKRD